MNAMSPNPIKPKQVSVVERFVAELQGQVDTVQRTDAIGQLRDIFVMNRLHTASHVESLRQKALRALDVQIASGDMPPDFLLEAIKTLSEIGEVDLNVATDTPGKGGGGININNILSNKAGAFAGGGNVGGSTAPPISGGGNAQVTSSTVKDWGNLLEAVKCISDKVRTDPSVIDGVVLPAANG